jgi:predicted phosphate transport protein (TIGR00153 family)
VFEKLMPREVAFFDYFEKQADTIVEGCKALNDLLENYTNVLEKAKHIKAIEHNGDTITHDCLNRLHQTFITPLDRDDIHRLITRMDDILDLTEAVSQRLSIYEIDAIPDHAKALAKVLVFGTERLAKAVRLLRNMRNSPQILAECIEINRIENEADGLLRDAVGALFKSHKQDPLYVIKWKELYELLESATDKCEDVANVLEGIVLEHA